MKKIFVDRSSDDEIHSDFLKFGRGEYRDRYLVEAKKQKDFYSIKTGPEYVNFLVRKCLEKIPGKVSVKGIIVSTTNLSDEAKFEISDVSNFQGIRKMKIETESESSNFIELMNKYPRVFFALSFEGPDFFLKVKAKAPKSAKPGKESEDGPRANFCTIKTKDKTIVDELIFDKKDFNEISINHTLFVEDIVYPKDMNSLKPEEIRERSKRKGKIVRKVVVDGKEIVGESEFIA